MSTTNVASNNLSNAAKADNLAAADKEQNADKPKPDKPKPEKPDEQLYLANVAKAEKEHSLAQEKVVCKN